MLKGVERKARPTEYEWFFIFLSASFIIVKKKKQDERGKRCINCPTFYFWRQDRCFLRESQTMHVYAQVVVITTDSSGVGRRYGATAAFKTSLSQQMQTGEIRFHTTWCCSFGIIFTITNRTDTDASVVSAVAVCVIHLPEMTLIELENCKQAGTCARLPHLILMIECPEEIASNLPQMLM